MLKFMIESTKRTSRSQIANQEL